MGHATTNEASEAASSAAADPAAEENSAAPAAQSSWACPAKGNKRQRRSAPKDECPWSKDYRVEDPDTPITAQDYIFLGSLRLVKPYFFDFVANVKQRWWGMTLVDLFAQEFPQSPREYYQTAMETGRLRIQGRKVGVNHEVKNGERCRHFVHRHEPPVLASPVQVLQVTDDVVAVNKPASMPVHVAGQYRKNTLLGVLQAEHPELGTLHSCQRLDKGVSGVLVLARNAKAANEVRACIQGGEVTKVYVARVLGAFPDGDVIEDTPLAWDPRTNHVTAVPQHQPQQESAGRGREMPKSACTKFRRLHVAPDGLTSVVECRPITGRTHQIRVHLQHLGHPIANDLQYGGSAFEGPAGASAAEEAAATPIPDGSAADFCPHCPKIVPRGYPVDLRPLWLHAIRYKFDGARTHCFETEMPEWAEESFEPCPAC